MGPLGLGPLGALGVGESAEQRFRVRRRERMAGMTRAE